MRKTLAFCLILVISLVLVASCTPVYQLKSGKYQMSLKTGSESAPLKTKTVVMTVEKNQITIKNPGNGDVLNGRLEGNQFKVSRQNGDQSVDFIGVLAADNQVKGDAIQKKDGKTLFNAGFELVPAN